MNNYPLTLLYDGACPLCRREMERLMRHNRAGLLRFVDISAAGFDAAHYGAAWPELMRVMHAVRPDGSFVTGIDAIRLAYRGAGFARIARLLDLPGVGRIARRAYPFIADHRYLLSGRLRANVGSAPACDHRRCNASRRH